MSRILKNQSKFEERKKMSQKIYRKIKTKSRWIFGKKLEKYAKQKKKQQLKNKENKCLICSLINNRLMAQIKIKTLEDLPAVRGTLILRDSNDFVEAILKYIIITYNYDMINRTYTNLPRIFRIIASSIQNCSIQKELINVPAPKYADHRKELKENIWRDVDVTGKKSQQTHLSNAEQLIKQIPVMRVTHSVVRCLGGTEPGTGHPQVYIQVNTRNAGEPVSCKWCGLRYALDFDHHH